VLGDVLARSGLGARVAQAKAVDDWPRVVGPQIAAVTEALWVTVDGTLVVRVATAAWRAELSLLAPTLLARLNAVPGRTPLSGVRFVHGAPRDPR
jgi:predicted nucleic acid-binding Zn ribbon protein